MQIQDSVIHMMMRTSNMKRVLPITFIDESVEKHKCPGIFFCMVATTVMSQHERENTCLKCWLRHCEKEGIEIDYNEGENG